MTGPAKRRPRRANGLPIAALVLAAAGLAALAAGCGGRRLAAGTVPFPAGKPVFVDAEGRPLASLPAAPEPLKLVVFDFPWGPPCADAGKAVGTAAEAASPGSLRVYRIVFDRERFFTRDGDSVVPPLRPPALNAPAGAAPRAFAVTTLTALPDAFRAEYEIGQAPLILLLSARGKVLKRWTGYSPSLSASLAAEIGRPGIRDQDSSESPPP